MVYVIRSIYSWRSLGFWKKRIFPISAGTVFENLLQTKALREEENGKQKEDKFLSGESFQDGKMLSALFGPLSQEFLPEIFGSSPKSPGERVRTQGIL